MTTPFSFRLVQMWIAVDRSTGSSKEPALIVSVAEAAPSGSCHSRDPQAGQKAQTTRRPLSADRVQKLGAPEVTRKPARGTSSDRPNAEADCLRHSRQWQT